MRNRGYFGDFGGQFVPELLMPALLELEEAFIHYFSQASFQEEWNDLLIHYGGRPTPIYFAEYC
jgi:tryptophan synthase beta chain